MTPSIIQSSVSGKPSLICLLPTHFDHPLAALGSTLAWFFARVTGNTNQTQSLPDNEKKLLLNLQTRCQVLSTCAQSLNPCFKRPFQLKVHEGPTMTRGGNVIYLSRDDLFRPLGLTKLEPTQKRSLLMAIVAHEIGHCILRHPLSINIASTLGVGMLVAAVQTLDYLTHRFTKLPKKATNCIALLIASPVIVKVGLCARRLFYRTSQAQEKEADGVSTLLIAKYNHICPYGTKVEDVMFLRAWTKCAMQNTTSQPPDLYTHPTTQQRQTTTHKALLMTRQHPDLLTDSSKRREFFTELQQDRPANDPAFMTQWNISEQDTILEALGIFPI